MGAEAESKGDVGKRKRRVGLWEVEAQNLKRPAEKGRNQIFCQGSSSKLSRSCLVFKYLRIQILYMGVKMKRLITGLVFAALFLGTLSAVAAGGGPSRAPELEKVTFVHYEKSSQSGPPTWDDTEDDYRLIMGGAKWLETMTYELNPGTVPGYLLALDLINTKMVLEESMETWDKEFGFNLFADSIGSTVVSSVGNDGTNLVMWSDLDDGVIAVNTLWIDPASKEIVESDVQFNTDYTWSTAEDCPKEEMDLQNIATHEFGHNGLDDLRPLKDGDLTMYAYSATGETKKRTLGYGDELGIQDLYGE
ncbi:hypothetical protein AKJ58_01270 [candidate division MSBL1 archaeon SCGC-AAA385D11]|uniref:Peptidase M10 metallopeptidase domain-containing protein n=1 Tax=candidate division MSBL1 archaeon SCGC-AAA385D11 TaxID=1698286 RepID=A0A133VNH6_9EURY|nr:hypothetical protein AKJ58_01270 [candidate division MSBL1 archaeon SCGC-AAA385D11]